MENELKGCTSEDWTYEKYLANFRYELYAEYDPIRGKLLRIGDEFKKIADLDPMNNKGDLNDSQIRCYKDAMEKIERFAKGPNKIQLEFVQSEIISVKKNNEKNHPLYKYDPDIFNGFIKLKDLNAEYRYNELINLPQKSADEDKVKAIDISKKEKKCIVF